MAIYRVELSKLAAALDQLVARVYPMLYTELRNEIDERAMLHLVEISPVATGKYRASHIPNARVPRSVVLPNAPAYAIPGIPEIEAVNADAAPGDPVFFANAAADSRYAGKGGYAALLEPGRREYSRRRRTGSSDPRKAFHPGVGTTMWIGSVDAPLGIYGPTRDFLLEQRATIEASAIQRVRERL